MPIADLLFLASVATIPIQLGKHFITPASYVLGIPIDYLTPVVYFSDIVILLYVFTSLSDYRKRLRVIFLSQKWFILSLLLLNLYLIVVLFRNTPAIPAYFSAKFFLFSLFTIFASLSLSKSKLRAYFANVLAVSLAWQAILILGQFLSQGSLGLWVLGERSFNSATPSIANISLFGNQILRPYGTFPHPNVAAAFMVFGLLILRTIKFNRSLKIISFTLAILALLLTFSKAGIIALLLATFVLAKDTKTRIFASLAIGLSILFIFQVMLLGQPASISERLTLIQKSLDISASNLLFGVGTTAFIPSLARLDIFSLNQIRLLQPVHNVFLLVLTENGIFGLLFFTALLWQIARLITNKLSLVIFLVLLIFLSLDHFLWTLEQGQLIFWLSIALILALNKAQPSRTP